MYQGADFWSFSRYINLIEWWKNWLEVRVPYKNASLLTFLSPHIEPIFFLIVKRKSMSALFVVNLLHWGQTHCLHCCLTLLIQLLSRANDYIITSYDACNKLQWWYLITTSLFHALLILCFNQQFFSFRGTLLSEFKRNKIIFWTLMLVRL